MNPEFFQQIVTGFTSAYKGLHLYPAQHPTIRSQLEKLLLRLTSHLEQREMLKVGLLEDTLFIDDHLFAIQTPASATLTQLLKQLKIEALEFHRGLTEKELLHFLQLLKHTDIDPEDLEAMLAERNIEHIRLAGGNPDED